MPIVRDAAHAASLPCCAHGEFVDFAHHAKPGASAPAGSFDLGLERGLDGWLAK
jgi:hypothetical protein